MRNSKLKKFIMISTFLLLSGCYSAKTISQTPDVKLCMDYLSKPSYNVNASTRAEEINRRGLDCSRYVGAALQQRRMDQQDADDLMRLSRDLNRANQNMSTIQKSSGAACFLRDQVVRGLSKVCVYDCAGSADSLTISASAICPLHK